MHTPNTHTHNLIQRLKRSTFVPVHRIPDKDKREENLGKWGGRGPGTAEQKVAQGWGHRQGCKSLEAWPSLCRLHIVVNKSLYFFEHLGASVKDNTSQDKAQISKNAPKSLCAVTLLQRFPLFLGLAEKKQRIQAASPLCVSKRSLAWGKIILNLSVLTLPQG